MEGSFFKGTSSTQDSRFADKESLLIKKMKFPASFDTKVDMRKVELSVMKEWITTEIIKLIGLEDDVLIEYIIQLLEDPDNQIIDAKKMSLLLTGFLESKTPTFMAALWKLLLSAQANPFKVPTELLDQKKKEMLEREAKNASNKREEAPRATALEDIRRGESENRFGDRRNDDRRNDDRRNDDRRNNDNRNDDRRNNDRSSFQGNSRGGRGGGGGGRGGDRFDRERDNGYGNRNDRDNGYSNRGRDDNRRGGNNNYGRRDDRRDSGRRDDRSRRPRSYSRSRSPVNRSRSRSRSNSPPRRRNRSFSASSDEGRKAKPRRRRSPSLTPKLEKSDNKKSGGRGRSKSRSNSVRSADSRSRSRSRSISPRNRSVSRSRSRSRERNGRGKRAKLDILKTEITSERPAGKLVSDGMESSEAPKSKWDREEEVVDRVGSTEGELKETLLRKKILASKPNLAIKGAATLL